MWASVLRWQCDNIPIRERCLMCAQCPPWKAVHAQEILKQPASNQQFCSHGLNKGGIFALRAHCALLLDYVPPEEPPSTPLGNALRIR